MTDALLELYRHKTWATLRLIEYCRGLGDEHLNATIPGTFGTIRETLRHLVGADEGYFSILTRKRLSEPLPDGVVKLDDLPAGPVPLEELADRIRRLGRVGSFSRGTPTSQAASSRRATAGACPGRCPWRRPSTTPTITAATSYRSSAHAGWRFPSPTVWTCGATPRRKAKCSLSPRPGKGRPWPY